MRYRFERYEISTKNRQAFTDGNPVAIGARAFDVLRALIERRDRVVSQNELREIVWPRLVVEENNLPVQINALRKLFGREIIATIPGRGYRFAYSVSTDGPGGDEAAPPAPAPATASLPSATVAPASATVAAERPAAPRPSAAPRRTNLPERLPPLYGRPDEIGRVRALLEAHPVVSIVASSGVGKTQLAQRIALAALDDHPDGVWWIELASLADGAMVAEEVARTLGFQLVAGRPALQTVLDVLRTQSLLLLLDNCEHLLPAVATLVDAIVRDAPRVQVLVTSQEPLKIEREQVFRLNTLALPATAEVADAHASGAVQLFVGRVRAADPRFNLDADNVAEAVGICRRLDGIPLALELAAARVPLLGVRGLAALLDERFRILTGGTRFVLRRHQTLRAALDFSHALLTAEEQKVFRRLGVFAGTFSAGSAQDVASDDAIDAYAALEIVGTLVDKSMVIAEGGDRPRLRLLETARAYALEKLGDAGETDALLARHAQVTARVFGAAHDEYWTTPDEVRMARYAPELDNLRAALSWSLQNDPALAIELSGNAGLFWMKSELHPEGARFCEAAVKLVAPTTPPLAHGRLLHAYAWMLAWSHPEGTIAIAREAAPLLRGTGDIGTLMMTLMMMIPRIKAPSAADLAIVEEIERAYDPALLATGSVRASVRGRVQRVYGNYAESRRHYLEGAALLAAGGANQFELTLRWFAGELALLTGDFETAASELRETARRRAQLAFKGTYFTLVQGSLITALLLNGEIAAAREQLAETVPLILRYGVAPRFAATSALLAASEGRWQDAAALLGYRSAMALTHPLMISEPIELRALERAEALLAANATPGEVEAWKEAGATPNAETAYARALAPVK